MTKLNNDSHRIILQAYLDRIGIHSLNAIVRDKTFQVNQQLNGSLSSQVQASRDSDETINQAFSHMQDKDFRLIEKIIEVEMEIKP